MRHLGHCINLWRTAWGVDGGLSLGDRIGLALSCDIRDTMDDVIADPLSASLGGERPDDGSFAEELLTAVWGRR